MSDPTPPNSDIEEGYETPDDQPTHPSLITASEEHKEVARRRRGKKNADMPGGGKTKKRKSRRKRKKNTRKKKGIRTRRKRRRKTKRKRKSRRKHKKRKMKIRRKRQHGGAGGVELENWRPTASYGFNDAGNFSKKIPTDSYPNFTTNPARY